MPAGEAFRALLESGEDQLPVTEGALGNVADAFDAIRRDVGSRERYLVFARDADLATVQSRMVDLARQLGAPLITYEGTQHTAVFNGIECIDTATVSYFVDGVVPGNLHC